MKLEQIKEQLKKEEKTLSGLTKRYSDLSKAAGVTKEQIIEVNGTIKALKHLVENWGEEDGSKDT